MKDLFEELCNLIMILIGIAICFCMLWAYVQVFADGEWVCIMDRSPRTCATIYKNGGVK